MGRMSKVASLFLLAGSIPTVAAGSWPTPTPTSTSASRSISSSSSSSTSSTDPWTAWPVPTDPSTSTSTTSYLATITPCPWCPPSIAPAVQNITQQLQTISTCSAAASACYKGRCHTSYPYSSWQWVSTAIPCSFNNFNTSATTDTGSSCLVTKTEDCVPVSKFTTTLTSYSLTTWTTTTYTTVPASTPSSTSWFYLPSPSSTPATTTSAVVEVIASPVPVYEYVEKDCCAVFSGLGPLAMLDHYDGSGLCTTCGVKGVGLTQAVSATECRTGYGFASTSCVTYVETWVSKPAPPATLAATATWSSQFYTSGSWDITFTGILPAQTISAPNGWATSDPTSVPWAFRGSCSNGPSTVDFTTTATTTVAVSIPWATHTDPYTGGWGDWAPTGSSTTSIDPSWSASSTIPKSTTTASTCGKVTATGYIKVVDLAVKYRKRQSYYVAFSGEDGIVVNGKADAATFVYDWGYLLSGAEYITSDGTGYSTFDKSPNKPADGNWAISGCGEYGPLVSGKDNFCESPLGSLFVEYDSSPAFTCRQVWLQFVPLSGPTSSAVWPVSTSTFTSTNSTTSTSTSTTGTSSSTTSSTPTLDPSSDPELPDMPVSTSKAKSRWNYSERIAHAHFI